MKTKAAIHICSKCNRKFKSSEDFNEHARKLPKPITGEAFADYKTRLASFVCPAR